MNEIRNGSTLVWGVIIVMIAAVLAADVAIPLGVAGGVPYVAPVLVSLWLPQRRYTVALAAITILLTVFGFVYSPPGGELWKVVLNRSYAVFAIGVVAMIGLQRKRLEDEASESEEWFQALYEEAPLAYFTVDIEGKVQMANLRATVMLGYELGDLIGRSVADLSPTTRSGKQRARELFWRYQSGQQVSGKELEMSRGDGRPIWVSLTVSPVLDADGNVILGRAMAEDITERKYAQEALKANQQWLSTTLMSIGDAVITTDSDGFVTFMNPTAERLTGWSNEESEGRPLETVFNIINEQTGQRAETPVEKILREGVVVRLANHTALIARDGTTRPIFDSGAPIATDQGIAGTVLVFRDATLERQAEEAALWESEERYRRIFTDSPVGIVLSDDELRIIEVNGAFCEMLGYTEEELLGKTIDDITYPEDVEAGVDFVGRRLTEANSGVQMEKRYVTKDDQAIWARVTGSVLWNDADQTPYALSIIEDVTDRKELQEQLVQAQKMEVVGQLAGGVAHDFNNLLTPLLGFAQLGSEDLPSDHPVQEHFREIKIAGERGAGLVRQLMIFSRQEVARPAVTNLNELVLNTDRMLRRIIGENIELVSLFASEPPRILIDTGQMEQVLVNLAVNARDAMSNGGKLTVETANVTLDETSARQFTDLAPGEYVRLSVIDTGMGMDEEVKSHLFEPFFTTKEPDKGTGLGLATCFGIITQAGGAIGVESEPGQGTSFIIYLPKVEAENVGETEVGGLEEMPRGVETILLVEDEPAVRRMGARVLERQGYTVLEAANGEDALRVAEEYSEQTIHLLLTDMVMPQMGGGELVERFRTQYPEVRTLITSGFPNEGSTLGSASDNGIPFLPKPFTPASLAREVRRVLDGEL